MNGCGACEQMHPNWEKLEGALKTQYSGNKKIVVAEVEHHLLPKMKYIGNVDGFPTMKYIYNS